MGADQHLDPEDRTELAVTAYELYGQLGSLSKVREHLATHATTLRLLGAPRHFSRATIKEFIDDGRAAESYVHLLKAADARADSDTRLSMLGAIVNEWIRLHGIESVDDMVKMVTALLKIEQTRITLHGWAAPTRLAHSLDTQDPAAPPGDMIRAIAAAREADAQRHRAIIEQEYPGPYVVPSPQRGRQRTGRPRNPPDPPARRTS